MDGLQHLTFFEAYGVGVEASRRLHGNEGEKLEQMIRHHIAQCAGGIVEPATSLDADGLRHCYLDVTDAIPVPKRLKHAIGEPKHHDVLNRFLSQIMVDTINLRLREHLEELAIERLC